ncbi:MAG: hypothetical protein SGI74_09710 [Oligoflexia bacterium]|nr:hypothetical protein [Oligoflexia bacterium]
MSSVALATDCASTKGKVFDENECTKIIFTQSPRCAPPKIKSGLGEYQFSKPVIGYTTADRTTKNAWPNSLSEVYKIGEEGGSVQLKVQYIVPSYANDANKKYLGQYISVTCDTWIDKKLLPPPIIKKEKKIPASTPTPTPTPMPTAQHTPKRASKENIDAGAKPGCCTHLKDAIGELKNIANYLLKPKTESDEKPIVPEPTPKPVSNSLNTEDLKKYLGACYSKPEPPFDIFLTHLNRKPGNGYDNNIGAFWKKIINHDEPNELDSKKKPIPPVPEAKKVIKLPKGEFVSFWDKANDGKGGNVPEPQKRKITLDDMRAIDGLARTIWGETRGCASEDNPVDTSGHAEMVARNILDRVMLSNQVVPIRDSRSNKESKSQYSSGEFGHADSLITDSPTNPIEDVVSKSHAYSLYNPKDPNLDEVVCPLKPPRDEPSEFSMKMPIPPDNQSKIEMKRYQTELNNYRRTKREHEGLQKNYEIRKNQFEVKRKQFDRAMDLALLMYTDPKEFDLKYKWTKVTKRIEPKIPMDGIYFYTHSVNRGGNWCSGVPKFNRIYAEMEYPSFDESGSSVIKISNIPSVNAGCPQAKQWETNYPGKKSCEARTSRAARNSKSKAGKNGD